MLLDTFSRAVSGCAMGGSLMKTVFLMRHADPYPTNFPGYEQERPLSVTGLLQVEQIRKEAFWSEVDFVLCSGVRRARQTFESLLPVLPSHVNFVYDDALQKRSAIELLDKIQWVPSIYSRLLVVGHNPVLTQFLEEILANSAVAVVETCEVVRLDANVQSWQEVDFNRFNMASRIRPEVTASSLMEDPSPSLFEKRQVQH